MRVIAGEFRSRRIRSMPGANVRPTPDRLREALFNVLAPRIEGAVFVDAYSGTGAVGIEAISRGAARAIFIEKDAAAVRLILANLRSLGAEKRARVVRGAARLWLPRCAADIVFLDPPYHLEEEYGEVLQLLGANPPSLVIVQHETRRPLADCYGRLRRVRVLKQGDNSLSFYEPEA